MFLVFPGCLEYGVYGSLPEQGEAVAEIDVSPMELSLEGVCTTVTDEVVVVNHGQGPLTITSVIIEGEGWLVGDIDLPLLLDPEGVVRLSLTAAVGNATLVIESDDPDESRVVVALGASANVAPYAVFGSPGEDDVLPEDESVQITAFVSDTETSPASLIVSLTSDVVGTIVVPGADSNGRIDMEWPASARVAGPQTLQLQVEDSCGAIGESSVYFCQDGPWTVSPLENHAWHEEGAADVDQSSASLALGPEVGAAFDAFAVYDGERTELSFRMNATGGSGLAVVALDASRMSGWLGGGGCGLGFGNCGGGTPLPGWALSFDFTSGDGNDCGPAPALAFVLDGEMAAPSACAALPSMTDGAWHLVDVVFESPRLSVRVDSMLVMDADVGSLAPFPAYLGFAGSDGDYQIDGFTATDLTCATAPD